MGFASLLINLFIYLNYLFAYFVRANNEEHKKEMALLTDDYRLL